MRMALALVARAPSPSLSAPPAADERAERLCTLSDVRRAFARWEARVGSGSEPSLHAEQGT